ncbi:hypothetical protein GCM10022255_006600 [Dactylosporangium darangshiense]|uniref:Uncharacterized protein n=1 Tax=Dactylosporangium darangshiense TaxID=579108 RepID=A0ABP8CWP7_9ACTN
MRPSAGAAHRRESAPVLPLRRYGGPGTSGAPGTYPEKGRDQTITVNSCGRTIAVGRCGASLSAAQHALDLVARLAAALAPDAERD